MVCTLIVATRAWTATPLVVAANRDELLARPSLGPALRDLGGQRLLAPADGQAGGTWIALNQHGVFGALTNRHVGAPDSGRRSRGEIVPVALGAQSAREAAVRVASLDHCAYNPFHVVVADRWSAWLVWSDDGHPAAPSALSPGVHVVTERSFGAAPTAREPLLRRALEAVPRGAPPPDGALASLLATHAPDGVCVHRESLGYGTRSATIVRLGLGCDDVTWRHAEGPPCAAPFSDVSDLWPSLARQPGAA